MMPERTKPFPLFRGGILQGLLRGGYPCSRLSREEVFQGHPGRSLTFEK